MKAKVTIQDLARQLNLTAATVSRALNNHPRISARTKKTVLELAAKLDYHRNRLASSLRSGRTYTIGVIIPSAEINFFGSVVHGIESLANMHGYNVLLYQSNESPSYEIRAIETFIGAHVDGILASVAKETMDFTHYLGLKEKGIPLVFFDRSKDSLNIPSVVVDDFKGAYLATQHLIQQGYKRIAHISGQQHLKIFQDRLNGYQAALKDAGFFCHESLVYKGSVSIASGREATQYLLALDPPPDAVFAVEDFTALGVIKAARDLGIQIPEQLGLVGFANEAFGEHVTPSLSSIDQQTVAMGKEAFVLLLELINAVGERSRSTSKVVLEPIAYFRQSSVRHAAERCWS